MGAAPEQHLVLCIVDNGDVSNFVVAAGDKRKHQRDCGERESYHRQSTFL